MKIILSRKGFDSSAGGVPSPIFPDGGLLSLPIPDKASQIACNDIAGEDTVFRDSRAEDTRELHRQSSIRQNVSVLK